jgi:hypothetical protein
MVESVPADPSGVRNDTATAKWCDAAAVEAHPMTWCDIQKRWISFLVWQRELVEGINVKTEDGEVLGKSKAAATAAVAQVGRGIRHLIHRMTWGVIAAKIDAAWLSVLWLGCQARMSCRVGLSFLRCACTALVCGTKSLGVPLAVADTLV